MSKNKKVSEYIDCPELLETKLIDCVFKSIDKLLDNLELGLNLKKQSLKILVQGNEIQILYPTKGKKDEVVVVIRGELDE